LSEVLGESGAYKGVVETLAQVSLSIASLDDIPILRSEMDARLEFAKVRAAADFEAETVRLGSRLDQAEVQMQASVAKGHTRFQQELDSTQAGLAGLRAEVEALGSLFHNLFPPKRLLNWCRKRMQIYSTRQQIRRVKSDWETARKLLAQPVAVERSQLHAHQSGRESYVGSRVLAHEQHLACLTRLLEEGEVAGAAAELEVIAILQQLPAGWVLLNDVNLSANRWYYYNKQHLKTAQLDHVVVGPGGIFVIETKNWSRKFVEKGDFFDPYEQIARAAFLCHKTLKGSGVPAKTRGIIATKTRLPTKPKDSYTKILRPDELCSYIRLFKPQITPAEVESVVAALSQFVNRQGRHSRSPNNPPLSAGSVRR